MSDEPYYACPCGYEFEEPLGAFGCPNCCGDNVAELIECDGE